jgi:hypothetical protein
MARFPRIADSRRRIGHARVERTKSRLDVEGLKSRVVLDAGLTPGTSTAGTLVTGASLVSFTDGASPLPANDYTATINWGDGTPLSGGTISESGTTFTVAGSHDFGRTSSAQPGGVYTVTVVITGDGQQVSTTTTATFGGLNFIAFEINPVLPIELAPLEALAGSPTSGIGLGPFEAIPTPDPTAYTAVVDWGDDSTPTAATIGAAGNGVLVAGTSGHTYAIGGNYDVTLTPRDSEGVVVGMANPTIAVNATLSGRLSPQSDTGISYSDGITNDTTPTFVGNTTPGTTVEVFATPSDSSTPGTQIAIGTANSAGAWSATVVNTPLTDGSYSITAEAINSFGTVLNTAALGSVVVDTVGPVITSSSFDRFTDTVTVTYQDNLSGLDYASIANEAFYHLSAKPVSPKVAVPKLLLPTSITVTPGATATAPEVVSVVFNNGHAVRAGIYLIVIDSGGSDTGVQDVAGNALAANFSGTFPSGDGLPGGDFHALIWASRNKVMVTRSVKVRTENVRPARPRPYAHH